VTHRESIEIPAPTPEKVFNVYEKIVSSDSTNMLSSFLKCHFGFGVEGSSVPKDMSIAMVLNGKVFKLCRERSGHRSVYGNSAKAYYNKLGTTLKPMPWVKIAEKTSRETFESIMMSPKIGYEVGTLEMYINVAPDGGPRDCLDLAEVYHLPLSVEASKAELKLLKEMHKEMYPDHKGAVRKDRAMQIMEKIDDAGNERLALVREEAEANTAPFEAKVIYTKRMYPLWTQYSIKLLEPGSKPKLSDSLAKNVKASWNLRNKVEERATEAQAAMGTKRHIDAVTPDGDDAVSARKMQHVMGIGSSSNDLN
tara:strand:- start:51 stop:977 length:927 start_codon:yes stop_codon:yes gene_type:complete